MPNNPPVLAGGNIVRASFIALQTGNTLGDMQVLQANTNSGIFGVAVDATQYAPLVLGPPSSNSNDVNAAHANEELPYYGPGETCLLTLGTGGATRNDILVSDANGLGITALTGSGQTQIQWVGARALESGAAAEKIRARVEIFPYRNALS